MKLGGFKVGQLASTFRKEPKLDPSDVSTSRSKYKGQTKRLESIFSRTEESPQDMARHRSRSKIPKPKLGKGLQKLKDKLKKSRGRAAVASESEPLIDADESETGFRGGATTNRRRPSKGGFRFNLITFLFILLFVCSAAGIIFIPIVHVIADKYLWITFGGSSVTLTLSFIGMSASAAILLSLYVIFFKLSDVRNKNLDDWTMVICYAVSSFIALTTILIAALHFHDVVEIFGEEFLELLQGYWITPRFHTGMDIIQMEFHCCGFYSYEDWQKVDKLEGFPDGFIPFSCCSIFELRPCIHDNVPKIQDLERTRKNGDRLTLESQLSIYPDGCKLPMENYYKTMLLWAIIISSCLLVTEVMLLLLLAFSRKPSSPD